MTEQLDLLSETQPNRYGATTDDATIDESDVSDELDALADAALSDELGAADGELAELGFGQAQLFDTDDLIVEHPSEFTHRCYSVAQIVEAAYQHYRAEGFPLRKLPLHLQLQIINKLADTSSDALLQSSLGYGVADTYHPHRLSIQIGHRPSPVMAFNDERKFKHALRLCLEQNQVLDDGRLLTTLSLVRGAQAAANFRPGFALLMYRRFAEPDGVVLDTSMGFGGRLVGFLASRCKHYIGIDPAELQFQGNVALANALCDLERQSFTLLPFPAEDVERSDTLLVDEEVDFAFTSPPYFSKEHYSNEATQSFIRYPEIERWRKGFLEPMMRLNFRALKPGAYCCINIAAVTIDRTTHALDEMTRDAGVDAGFQYKGTERFPISRGFGQGVKKEAFEPMLIFRKGD